MSEPGIKVEGLARLVRTLRRAGADLGELKDANRAAAEMVAAEGRARAPRRSGDLAGTIRSARAAARARVLAGRASVPYAAPIHWGWPLRDINAQPFLSEAAQATEPRWVKAYLRDVEHALGNVQGA